MRITRRTWIVLAVLGSLLVLLVLRAAYENIRGPRLGGDMTVDLALGVTMEFKRIEAGQFMMGSPVTEKGREEDEGPQRRVTISRPFYMGVHEVTKEQYAAIMWNMPSWFENATHPAEGITWEDAAAFCAELSRKTGRRVRLPTEAEWEYACRAGTGTAFYTGETISTDEANYDGQTVYGDGRGEPTAVASFPPNAWGLYDMHGNVWEWCCDGYAPYASAPTVDPQGPISDPTRVVRGGSHDDRPESCRSAHRHTMNSKGSVGSGWFGFRVVIEID